MNKQVMSLAALGLLSYLLSPSGARAAGQAAPARLLSPLATIQDSLIAESSALQRSRRRPGMFWTLNDSGDEARLFAIDSSGATLHPAWFEHYQGLRLPNAQNLDWEDLAQDAEGNLLIGAFGNNSNARRDLGFYVLPEPNPLAVGEALVLKHVFFAWPDQHDFPPAQLNFDCEAFFFARGALHFLTKHRSDTKTRLYRLDEPPRAALPHQPWHEAFRPDVVYPLTFLGEADVAGLRPEMAGLVTAADATLDGSRLAILTYSGVFVVDNPAGGEAERTGNLLAGAWRWLPIEARQCEGLALDGETLWITNEQREIFRLPVADLAPRTPRQGSEY